MLVCLLVCVRESAGVRGWGELVTHQWWELAMDDWASDRGDPWLGFDHEPGGRLFSPSLNLCIWLYSEM